MEKNLNQPRNWYDKKRFVLPLLLFIFPVGVIVLWGGKSFPVIGKVLLTAGMLAFYGSGYYLTKLDNEENVKVEQQAIQLLNEGKIDEAKVLIENITSKRQAQNLYDIKTEIDKAQSPEYVREMLATMTDEEFENLKKGIYKGSFANAGLNTYFITNLQNNADKRADLILEYKAAQEAQQKEQETKALAEAQASRAEKLKGMFSAYDGSHRGLVSAVEKNMNDPDSFDHVETRFSDKGDYILVYMKYRGKNSFGALVLGEITVKSDLDGNIFEEVR